MSVAKICTFGATLLGGLFAQQDGDRIGLLAGGAAGHPDADLLVRALALEELGNDEGLKRVKGIRIAEEIGHADQQVAKQRPSLVRIRLQPLDIAVDLSELLHLHAPLHAALERLVLVLAKIVPDPRA